MRMICIIISVFVLFLSGCNKYDKPVVEFEDLEMEYETGFYDILSKEQLEYLKETFLATSEEALKNEINELPYEILNTKLMLTGLELYNKQPEIAYEGVTFSYKDSVAQSLYGKYYSSIKCTTDQKITLEEVFRIADKGNDIRPEDFLKYNFEVVNINENKNDFWISVEGFDGQIRFKVEEYEDGTAHMSTPYLGRFSMHYERELIDIFLNQEPKGTFDGKMIVVVECGTLSDISLVLSITNNTDKEYVLDNSYVLYRQNDNKEYVEYKAYESENIMIVGTEMFNSAYGGIIVGYATKDNPLPAGKYKLEFGKDREGYVYKEIEFEIE